MNETPNEPMPDLDPGLETDAEAGPDAPADDGMGPLDQMIAERDRWKDRALRAAAEAENVRRRTEGQMNDARAYAIQRFARDLLGVADSLERALQAAPQAAAGPDAGGQAAGLVTGLEMTQKALLAAFESNGLTQVAPRAGEAFDPHLHQAMMEQVSDQVAGGAVIQTLQTGWSLFGRTLRPAMVVVAAKAPGTSPAAAAQAYARAADAQ